MFGVSELFDGLQDQAESRKSRNGSGKECDKVAFADSRVLGAFLYECMIAQVALEFGTMSSFSKWVVFDVGLVLVTPEKRCYMWRCGL
jgi:hypothetical protein